MQVSVESTGSLERRLNFTLSEERLNTTVNDRLREVARTVRINGFRPGKVPPKLVEQRYGKQIRAEALETLLRETFDDAIREQDLRMVGMPRIDRDGDSEFDFVATFEVMPDFGEIDVTKLTIERATAEVTDADIDQMIENLRLQRRTWNPVERAAQKGDMVSLESWTQVDDVRLPPEGVESGPVLIGTGTLLPALEDELIGMEPGTDKTVKADFPADWQTSHLAGKQADVYLKVTQVTEPVLPEVDSAFIKSFGVKSGDIEQFRKEIRANLERELKGALMNRLRRAVGDQLIVAYSEVDLPPRLVEDEARAMLHRVMEQAKRAGRDPGNLSDNAHEPYMVNARKRVLVGLLVGEIANRHNMLLDNKRLTETLRMIASTYEQPEQVIEMYRNDPQLMKGLQNRVLEEQVIDWVAEHAQSTDKAISFQEAIRQ